MRRLRVLRHVVQRLEGAEVDGGLHVQREPADPVRLHRDRNGRLAGLRLQGGGEASVREQRWVDPPRQIAKVFECRVRFLLEFPGERLRAFGVAIGELLEQPELHGQGHELLLGAVVDVPLQAPPLLVLGAHQTLARCLQLLDQAHVAKDQSRLGREIAHDLLPATVELVVGRHRHRERAEEVSLMANLGGEGPRKSGNVVERNDA